MARSVDRIGWPREPSRLAACGMRVLCGLSQPEGGAPEDARGALRSAAHRAYMRHPTGSKITNAKWEMSLSTLKRHKRVE